MKRAAAAAAVHKVREVALFLSEVEEAPHAGTHQTPHSYSPPTKYSDHKAKSKSDKPPQCTVCGKKFQNQYHLELHQHVHTDERPFSCDRCSRTFATNSNLKRHQMIHAKEQIYRCTTCGVLFCQLHDQRQASGSAEEEASPPSSKKAKLSAVGQATPGEGVEIVIQKSGGLERVAYEIDVVL